MGKEQQLASHEDDLGADSLGSAGVELNLALDILLGYFGGVVDGLDGGGIDDAGLELPLVAVIVGGVDAEAVGAVTVAVILVFRVEMAGDREGRRANLHINFTAREQHWNNKVWT